MPEEAVQQARICGHLVRFQIFGRRGVERFRVLDRKQLLALLVALFVTVARLCAQVLRQRSAAREQALEVRLVLGVPGAPLERVAVFLVAARGTATIAHLVDLTPAFLLPRAIVVCHRCSTGIHRITRLRFTGSLGEGLSDPSAENGSVSASATVVALPHGRVPPHNLDAEKSLLGGILLDSQAFADVVEIVRADEFYRDGHRKVFEAMSALFGNNQPIDRITVKDELTAMGAFEAVGGDEFIDLLDKIVPTAANLAWHAMIIHEKALARRLIEAASSIAQLGYEQHGDVAEFADECERRIFAVTEERNAASFGHGKPIIAATFKNIEALYERQEGITGIPTGFADLDRLTSGFQPGDLVVLAARPSMGKAQPLDAPVLTPTGYVPMGEIRAGSSVIGADGKPHRGIAVFPQGVKTVFRVRLDDGATVECCDEHLWYTTARAESAHAAREGSVKTLAAIRRTLHVAGAAGRPNPRPPLLW